MSGRILDDFCFFFCSFLYYLLFLTASRYYFYNQKQKDSFPFEERRIKTNWKSPMVLQLISSLLPFWEKLCPTTSSTPLVGKRKQVGCTLCCTGKVVNSCPIPTFSSCTMSMNPQNDLSFHLIQSKPNPSTFA